MALEAIINRPDVHKVILEEASEMVYLFAFALPSSDGPFYDRVYDNWDQANQAAFRDYEIRDEMWREIPDTGMG